jgi:hypothetical protein
MIKKIETNLNFIGSVAAKVIAGILILLITISLSEISRIKEDIKSKADKIEVKEKFNEVDRTNRELMLLLNELNKNGW